MTLTQDEKHSPLWRKLKEHWSNRIDMLHSQLEIDADEAKTANLRGRLAECRACLTMDKELPDIGR